MRLIGCFCLALVSLTSAPAYAEASSADARGVIISRLSLVKTQDLLFGDFIPNESAAGTVTVSPDGVRTSSAGITEAGGTVQHAEFVGYGTVNRFVRIRTNASSFELTRQGGSETMTLRNLRLRAENLTIFTLFGTVFGRINPDGVITMRVGGTLDVSANQEPGTYTGTFPLIVDYF